MSSSELSVWWPKTALPTGRQLAPVARPPRLRPSPPSRTGSRRLGGKKRELSTTYLDEALTDFSGYLAIDDVYHGPFCILSVVDDRRYDRLAFPVLDHAPTHDDIRDSLGEFGGHWGERGLGVLGITTDGSSLYPKVLKELWPNVPHQM